MHIVSRLSVWRRGNNFSRLLGRSAARRAGALFYTPVGAINTRTRLALVRGTERPSRGRSLYYLMLVETVY